MHHLSIRCVLCCILWYYLTLLRGSIWGWIRSEKKGFIMWTTKNKIILKTLGLKLHWCCPFLNPSPSILHLFLHTSFHLTYELGKVVWKFTGRLLFTEYEQVRQVTPRGIMFGFGENIYQFLSLFPAVCFFLHRLGTTPLSPTSVFFSFLWIHVLGK